MTDYNRKKKKQHRRFHLTLASAFVIEHNASTSFSDYEQLWKHDLELHQDSKPQKLNQ